MNYLTLCALPRPDYPVVVAVIQCSPSARACRLSARDAHVSFAYISSERKHICKCVTLVPTFCSELRLEKSDFTSLQLVAHPLTRCLWPRCISSYCHTHIARTEEAELRKDFRRKTVPLQKLACDFVSPTMNAFSECHASELSKICRNSCQHQ